MKDEIKTKYKNIIMILIGIMLSNNVFYVLNVNTFYLNVIYAFSILIIVILLFMKKLNFKENIKKMNKEMLWFFIFSSFSIIPSIICFIEYNEIMRSCLYGIINIILVFLEYFVIMRFDKEKDSLIKGIVIGFILNLIVSLITFIMFNNGNTLTFANIFPNPAFQICGSWNDYQEFLLNNNTSLWIFFYRAQGLFLETSYYTIYLIGTFLIILNYVKNTYLKIVLIILTLFLGLISESGNMLILIICYLLFLLFKILKRDKKEIIIHKIDIITIMFSIIIISGFIMYIISNEDLMNNLYMTFSSATMNDEGNVVRVDTFKYAFDLAYKYPFGTGVNTASNLISIFYTSSKSQFIFSSILTNLVEIGIIGTIIYCYANLRVVILLLKYSKNKIELAVAISYLGLLICQIVNGFSYYKIPCMIGIYALANIFLNQLKKDKELLYIKENEKS